MSNLSAINAAILAGQKIVNADHAIRLLREALHYANGAPENVRKDIMRAMSSATDYSASLLDTLDAARAKAQRTSVFFVGDVPVDVPEGFAVRRPISQRDRLAVVVAMGNCSGFGVSAVLATVRTVEENGDDVGGFLVSLHGKLGDQVYSAEHIALKAIFAQLLGE